MRLLTWNIRSGRGLDERVDLERVAALIRSLRPEVVALQEVDAYQARSGGVAQWRELARRTDMSGFYGPNEWRPFGEAGVAPPRPERPQYGNALLTRLPVRAVENHLLTYRAAGEGYKEQRGCLEVEVLGVDGQPVVLLCTHWGLHPEERRGQAEDLLALAGRRAPRPVVALGDFNAAPEAPEMAALRAAFQDAGAAAGPTFPSEGPATQRIDYCLVPASWRVIEAAVLETVASDHRPLWVVAEDPGPPR